MLFVLRNFGGTLEWYARDDSTPRRPDATVTVQVLDTFGGALVAAGTAATLDLVNTPLSSGAAVGATTLQVTAATNIVAGRRYVIGDTWEEVKVKRVSGTTVYLTSPTWAAHASGAAFAGHRISYTLSASQAGTVSKDYCRALFSWLIGTVAQPPGQVEFALTRYYPRCPITAVDLFTYDENLADKLPLNTDIADIINEAWDNFKDDVSAKGAWIYDYVGSERARSPVIYGTLALCADRFGREPEVRDRFHRAYIDALATFGQVAPIDTDRDGAVEPHEEGAMDAYRMVRG